MYKHGQGVPQDSAQAVTWYRRAAEQGLALAQLDLGLMYETGQGVSQDNIQAHKWLNQAAARASASEHQLRELAVAGRDRVAARMTAAQIAEAQRLAREWKPR
jgi:TPR repeat protein